MSEKSTPSVLGLGWALVTVRGWVEDEGDMEDEDVEVATVVALLGGMEKEFPKGKRAKHSKRRGIETIVQKALRGGITVMMVVISVAE
jgi:hypothetical protein